MSNNVHSLGCFSYLWNMMVSTNNFIVIDDCFGGGTAILALASEHAVEVSPSSARKLSTSRTSSTCGG